MGRPPKALEGIPPTLEKLTDKQAELLAWIYRAGLGGPALWSAKTYLGRSPTRSEAATLSKRVTGLVEQGALERYGRYLKLTQEGWVLLYNYATGDQDSPALKVLAIAMELERIADDLDSFADIVTTAIRCLNTGIITQPEFETLRSALHPLRHGLSARRHELEQMLAGRQLLEKE